MELLSDQALDMLNSNAEQQRRTTFSSVTPDRSDAHNATLAPFFDRTISGMACGATWRSLHGDMSRRCEKRRSAVAHRGSERLRGVAHDELPYA
ncbi:hypothetical protein EYF80_022048 [Liparis tanakae]|uniref:Uncharacterized protein n=1 Tax=Liparis tanakae TaxID=230148 RepID=A0A4Z2HSD8_9TELE|nr:hypothetical protein EYF80_022048 [Liparis tanakae]